MHDVPRDYRAPRNAATTEAPPSAPTAEPTSGGSLRDEGSAPIRRPRRRRRPHGWVAAALQQHGRHGRGNAFVRVCHTHPRNEVLLGDAPRRLMTRAGRSGRPHDGGSVLRVRVAAQYGQTTLSWILARVAALLQVSLRQMGTAAFGFLYGEGRAVPRSAPHAESTLRQRHDAATAAAADCGGCVSGGCGGGRGARAQWPALGAKRREHTRTRGGRCDGDDSRGMSRAR